MKCTPLLDPATGRVIGIACGPRRTPKCATCKAAAQLECDGCDRPLCNACAVSPRKCLDFCPACFEPAWKHWLQTLEAIPGHRGQRRDDFRAWARSAPEEFLRLSRPLTPAARKASP